VSLLSWRILGCKLFKQNDKLASDGFSRLTKEGLTHDHGRADLGMTMADL